VGAKKKTSLGLLFLIPRCVENKILGYCAFLAKVVIDLASLRFFFSFDIISKQWVLHR
jgi:hypothetical protein